MNTLLVTSPATRINDKFTRKNCFNAEEPTSHYIDEIIQGTPNNDFRFYAEFYKNIGVDIVTETVFDYPYCFITEKTYRAIASLRPFIIAGPYGSLKFLKSFGFRTFSCIIDETYDEIQDPDCRMLSIFNTITEFVDRPLCAIKKDIQSVEDILLHNQNVLSSLFDKELTSLKEQINDSN